MSQRNKIFHKINAQAGITLIFAILLGEILALNIPGDFGGIIWAGLHFFLFPLLCLIYVIILLVRFALTREGEPFLVNIIILFLLFIYVYLSVTGNTLWGKVIMTFNFTG
jgi:hypothetical protein